ncbi:asparagine synthase family [Afipia carboxidovorans OM5]|uniref:Putative asparagine synthase n=1 Tax=Afipia carboxidovorans (strain ATCC 49405 / DSM 1227 / KCTC 32145 / OM5) TaxID=504832 RepID=B6JJJ7_AFIC5|nr:asparagine synthase C-terminal domain-containing protein [Afipia carboxidovorans]ACI94591.1 asparagine synthase family [Afipia carboxidovorans OM5]AEI01795.1 putative asparagine synthase [Afipia carboxidovorans OM4]AEI05370.1 putative asparagine synthase [Afipia carboxidovorans OM5]
MSNDRGGSSGTLSEAILLPCRDGLISIEGIVQRVDGEIGAAALRRLVEIVERDGPAALACAEGDFVALVQARDAVHAFKSFTSQYQIYYREADGLVANRLFAFWDAAGEWNEDYFARHVLIVPGYQFLSRETPIKNVVRVLPGELVSLRAQQIDRRQLVRRNYAYRFDPDQRREEVAEQVLHLLRDGVKTRLAARPQARICVEISGGLDSSFIACLLGEQLSGGIRGVMFSQPRLPSHAISEQYARDVADRYGIELVVLPPEDLPVGVPDAPGYSDEPSDFFWFGDIFSRAVAGLAAPNSYVFTGFGADQLFLRSPAFLPHLLRQKQYRAFRNTLPEASRLLSRGQVSIGWQCLLSQIPAELHRRLQHAWPFRGWNPWDVSDVNMERALTDDIAWLRCGKSLAAYSQERAVAEATLVGNGILCDDWGYFSAPRAVTQAHFSGKSLVDASPFCDLPLLDYVYDQISALLVHDFGARYKELLRDAQKGVVPDNLRNRQNDTFVFNSFQMAYIDATKERLESLLDEVDAAWIDVKAARLALQQLSFGMASSSTRSVTALLGYLQWRRSFLDFCAQRKASADHENADDGFFQASRAGLRNLG